MTELPDLDRRTRALARHDRSLRIFGATLHSWTVYRLSPEEVSEAEERHGLPLPPAYRWWVTEGPGAGAGPFYGLLHPLDSEPGADELAGSLPLADHGCGYMDWLSPSGEVKVDLRGSSGPIDAWYPTFQAWLDAWLTRSYAEWGAEYLPAGLPDGADPAFVAEVRDALSRVDGGAADPLLAQYPLPLDKVRAALARLHLEDGAFEAAATAFEAAAGVSREPDAQRALGRCQLAAAQNDAAARLAAADEGLAAERLWWNSRGHLLEHKVAALEALARWDEALAAREAGADHDRGNVQKNLEVVRIRVERGDIGVAADRVVGLAERGLGCDGEVAMDARVEQVVHGLLEALAGDGRGDRADALRTALAERVGQ